MSIKRKIKKFITWLFFKYCYEESKLTEYLQVYWVPNTLRKTNGTLIDGQFLFAQLEEKSPDIKYTPLVDIPIPGVKK